MLEIILRELLFDLKGMFRRWNLIVFFIFSGLIILMSKTEGEDEIGTLVLFFTMWCCLIMKPKVNKLHYILPGEEKSRVFHILIKSFGIILFIMLWYISMMGIITALIEYQFMTGLMRMYCEVIPFVIAYVSINMNNGYNTNSPNKGNGAKKNQFRYVVSYLIVYTIMMYVLLFSKWIRGGWYIMITIAIYLSAIIALYCQFMILKHIDTSYDNIRKVEKFFN